MTDTAHRPISDAQLDAIASLDVHLDDEAAVLAADRDRAEDAAIERHRAAAAEPEVALPSWLASDEIAGPSPAPLRTTLIVDYLEARSVADQSAGGVDQYAHMLHRGQQYGAALALARCLVAAGEWPTVEAAAEAIANYRVPGMRTTTYGPDGFTPNNQEVPF